MVILWYYIISFLVVGALAAPSSPVSVDSHIEERADTSDVLAIIDTLQSEIAPALSSIETIAGSIFASTVTLSPFIADIVASLNTATASLAVLGTVDSSSGGSPAAIANAVAPIVSNIVITLNNAEKTVPGVNLVIATLGLDASLDQFLTGLEASAAGVINIVSQSLVDVAGLMSGLSLGLVLGTLGIS